jgi:hypothetical protein
MRPTRPAEGCRGGLRLPRLWRPPAAPSHPGKRRPKINDALLLWRPGLWGSRQASPDPHGLKDASSDPAQLTGWWRRWPQANIGLVTGELADSWTSTAGRMALRRLAADHDLRLEGPLAETGIGWHLYPTPTGSGTTELGISMPATAGAGACGGAGLSAGQVVRSRSKNKR